MKPDQVEEYISEGKEENRMVQDLQLGDNDDLKHAGTSHTPALDIQNAVPTSIVALDATSHNLKSEDLRKKVGIIVIIRDVF